MKKINKRAFTLIELLVVIAIIALLFAIIMPSLQLAKMKAAGAVCASRQHYAILSYTLYADDNDSHLVNSDTMVSGTYGFVYWVEPPTELTIEGRHYEWCFVSLHKGHRFLPLSG